MITKDDISHWFKQLQQDICGQLEETDGRGKFITDSWQRTGGGGGLTRIMSEGKIVEKGGVNFSEVWGQTPEAVLKSMELQLNDPPDFFATGVSIVVHPHSPMVPIIHMNVRYFEMSNGTWWFGGGIDLTPHYVDPSDAKYFHQQLKSACDRHHLSFYPKFKTWADDYFYLKHRNETRGVGGIFFDYLKADDDFTRESRFDFVKSVGSTFSPVYTYFMKKNHSIPYGENEKRWQHLRRGRYVEFNLVWDRGTKFGLDTDGRTESILMSLPPRAEWQYQFVLKSESAEAKTQSFLQKGIDWIGE
ncbi:MAG TPA: oxygen-dependent coproporphyrinogen oxidase [Chryseolinea sp.]|nr:oxygen-dependent coproporphyrinogen oxidase [Chryseolinea sp.]